MLLLAFCKYVGFTKDSVAEWPFTKKVSALPHFLSFKVSQDDKTAKKVSDPLNSAGFMAISKAHSFDAIQKRSAGEAQVWLFVLKVVHFAQHSE